MLPPAGYRNDLDATQVFVTIRDVPGR